MYHDTHSQSPVSQLSALLQIFYHIVAREKLLMNRTALLLLFVIIRIEHLCIIVVSVNSTT
jgi:hypothetical protein